MAKPAGFECTHFHTSTPPPSPPTITPHNPLKMTFTFTNSTAAPPSSPLTSPFTILAPPSTDIWRKPPHHTAFTAPILHTTLPLSHFHRARVTVTAPWKTLYDQGGLFFARPSGSTPIKWIKAGIEFFDGRPRASIVAADNWADWSLVDIEGDEVTVEFARPDKESPNLWVYLVEGGGRRRPVREVTWAFAGAGEGEEVWIGVYAAKPTVERGDAGEGLEVRFSGLVVE